MGGGVEATADGPGGPGLHNAAADLRAQQASDAPDGQLDPREGRA
jgi:hypothetical protein